MTLKNEQSLSFKPDTSRTAPITQGVDLPSREFKYAAITLLDRFKDNQLRKYLLEIFGINQAYTGLGAISALTAFERSRHKRLGSFYTPASIAERIISKITINRESKYLDPAIGTGNLLLLLVKAAIAKLPDLSIDNILDAVYGFDIDWEAVEICKLRILLELQNKFAIDKHAYQGLNLYVTDFTVKPSKGFIFLKDFNPIYMDSEIVLNIKNNIKFSCIICNPPFVTFYGRRSKKLAESHREYYLSNYDFVPSSVKNGKLNLYMFFVEHGLNMLQEGGDLIYLLDNSVYENSGYHLRRWLLENFQIKSIDMGLEDFDNVASGQTIWHITNNIPQTYYFASIQDISKGYSQKVDPKRWLDNDECRIDFLSECSIVEKLSNYKCLVDYFPKKSIRTCCMLLDLTEKFLVDKEQYERDRSGLIMPYLEGSKSLSSPDEPLKFNHYIKYDLKLQLRLNDEIRIQLEKEGIKNKKRIGLGSLEIYQSPKILIRQSSTRLIAKWTDEKFMANNSLYVLTSIYSNFRKEDWHNVLIYTERLLNSKLYLYLAYKMKVIRKNPKQQPQIKVSDLKRLPFCIANDSIFFNKIISFRVPDINAIDRLVYEEFGLDSEEITEIECFARSV